MMEKAKIPTGGTRRPPPVFAGATSGGLRPTAHIDWMNNPQRDSRPPLFLCLLSQEENTYPT